MKHGDLQDDNQLASMDSFGGQSSRRSNEKKEEGLPAGIEIGIPVSAAVTDVMKRAGCGKMLGAG
jgi:hypothetical protein